MENKELTLWDLCLRFFQWFGNALKLLVSLFGKSLQLCYRHLFVSIAAVLIVVGFFIFDARPSNKWYKAEGVMLLNGPQAELAREVLKPVEKAFSPDISPVQNYSSLLGVSEDVAEEHKSFKTHFVIDCLNDSTADFIDYDNSSSMTDTLRMRMTDRLAFTFQTRDPQLASVFADSVRAYLCRDPRVKASFRAYETDLRRESLLLNRQIHLLDSLTDEFYFHQGIYPNLQYTGNPNNLLIGRREIKLFYNDLFKLVSDVARVDNRLSFCTAPAVALGEVAVSPKAVNGLFRYAIYGLLLGFLLALLLSACIEFAKPVFAWLAGK